MDRGHGHYCRRTVLEAVCCLPVPPSPSCSIHWQHLLAHSKHACTKPGFSSCRRRYGDLGEEPLLAAARSLSSGLALLCLDELAVTDLADGLILSRMLQVRMT